MITFNDIIEWHRYDLKPHKISAEDREKIEWLISECQRLKYKLDNLQRISSVGVCDDKGQGS